MLYWAQNNEALFAGIPLWAIAPGVCIALLGASFALLNYAFDEISSPALRVRKLERARFPKAEPPPPEPTDAADQHVLKVQDLTVAYATDSGPVVAVDHVDFELGRSEFLAIVGESGCGKSTLLYAIARLLGSPLPGEIVGGRVLFQGRDLVLLEERELRRLRWRDLSIVMQSAMNALNPVLTVADQMRDACEAHSDMSKKEIRDRSREVLRLVSIDPVHLHSYPHQLSGGMRQRAMIAIAIARGPSLLVADEPTSALDATVEAGILDLFRSLQQESGMGILLVTHDLAVVAQNAHRMAVMYAGRVVETGSVAGVLAHPRHPYTIALLRSHTSRAGSGERLAPIPGRVPAPGERPSGCRFRDRCPIAKPRCAELEPALLALTLPGPPRAVACHYDEEAAKL